MKAIEHSDSARYLAAIPVYNERPYIHAVIARVKGVASDILVIDDGSTDGSREALEEMSRTLSGLHLIKHSRNQGYGQSLIDAFRFAVANDYDYIVTLDCDEQHEPEDIPRFINAFTPSNACEAHSIGRAREIRTYDIVSGSRYLLPHGDGQVPPPDRYAINREITELLNEATQYHLTDSFCGFKAYKVDALRRMDITEKGYGMPLQLWIQASKLDLQIREIPVKLIYKDASRTFGAGLDDPSVRLRYYREIIERELKREPFLCGGAPTFCSSNWADDFAATRDDFQCGADRVGCFGNSCR